MKSDLRDKLAEPFGGLRTETLNQLEEVVNKHTLEVIKHVLNSYYDRQCASTIEELAEEIMKEFSAKTNKTEK